MYLFILEIAAVVFTLSAINMTNFENIKFQRNPVYNFNKDSGITKLKKISISQYIIKMLRKVSLYSDFFEQKE